MMDSANGNRCECCGDAASIWYGRNGDRLRHPRCHKHHDRNPCAIEGCCRTTAACGRYGNDQFLCSEHWRRYCPPGSPLRRTYHRFFRLAKKQRTPQNPDGWDDALKRRFWRFWDVLIKRSRQQSTEGRIDIAEINRLFGWEITE